MDKIYDAYDLAAARGWQPIEGLPELFNDLKNYKIVLVTSVGRIGLTNFLQKFQLEKLFGLIITRNDVKFLKPSTEGLAKALRANVIKSDVIHVGDSVSDLLAANKLGIKKRLFIGVNHTGMYT